MDDGTASCNSVAYAASHTAEGLSDYYNFMEMIEEASKFSYGINLLFNQGEGNSNTKPSNHDYLEARSNYSQIIENHIIYFCKKYKYASAARDIENAHDFFLEAITTATTNPSPDRNGQDVAKAYLKVAELLGRALIVVSADFNADKYSETNGRWGYDEGFDEDIDDTANAVDDMAGGLGKIAIGAKQDRLDGK